MSPAIAASSVTLDPTSGPVNTEITATGSGFTAGNKVVDIFWDKTYLTETRTDNSGNFSVSFNVPQDSAVGTHQIIFNSDSEDTESFNVLAQSQAPSALSVSEADFDMWCVSHGADEARIIDGTAYGWACYKGGAPSPPSIDMLTYCQNRYPGLNFIDFLGDFHNPLSWQCFGPVEFLGGLNLYQYCVNHGYSNVSPPGSTVENWSCVAPDGRSQSIRTYPTDYDVPFSMSQACTEQYNLPIVRVRVADHNNAASVQCWGSSEIPVVPTAPSDISVSMTSDGAGIGVSWKDNSNNEAGFDIFNGIEHLQAWPNQTFLSSDWDLKLDQNGRLVPGQYVCFQVSAYNTAGSSAPAPWSCIETPGQAVPPPAHLPTVFNAPFSKYVSLYAYTPATSDSAQAVCKGLSGFLQVQTDANTGLLGYSGFAWGGICTWYNFFSSNNPPAQQAIGESLLGDIFTAPTSGTYRISADIELHGNGGAKAGSGAGAFISAFIESLVPGDIGDAIGLASLGDLADP